MIIVITTSDIRRSYEVATGPEAVQLFFDDIRADKVSLSDLGFIGTWHEGDEDYPFRIGPALFKCGLLSQPDLDASFEQEDMQFTPEQVGQMASADAWMVREGPVPKERLN